MYWKYVQHIVWKAHCKLRNVQCIQIKHWFFFFWEKDKTLTVYLKMLLCAEQAYWASQVLFHILGLSNLYDPNETPRMWANRPYWASQVLLHNVLHIWPSISFPIDLGFAVRTKKALRHCRWWHVRVRPVNKIHLLVALDILFGGMAGSVVKLSCALRRWSAVGMGIFPRDCGEVFVVWRHAVLGDHPRPRYVHCSRLSHLFEWAIQWAFRNLYC